MTPSKYNLAGDDGDLGHLEPHDIAPFTEAFSIVTAADGRPVNTTIVLPDDFAVYRCAEAEDKQPLINILTALGVMPNCVFDAEGAKYYVYHVPQSGDRAKLKYITPQGAELLVCGADIPLPDSDAGDAFQLVVNSPEKVATIESGNIEDAARELGVAWPPPPAPHPVVKGLRLEKHSLQGKADEMAKQAVAARPLLGQVCLSGQSTVWYAPPNSGKTLIGLALTIRAVHEERIHGGNIYYVNADDNSSGIAEKLRVFDELGGHTLVPGFNGFNARDLRPLLIEMAQKDKARGLFIVLDTVKAFASLMDKSDVSNFADACRQFVARGGTILIFAHTNKNATADGSLKYAGTTDLVEQLDAAYIITPMESEETINQKIVRFKSEKRRGDEPDVTAYTYSTENGLTYDQLLASVEEASFEKTGELERKFEERSDAELIEAIKTCIREGINTKMKIASTVSKRCKTSGKGVIRVIERYTGDDPARHHWTFAIKDRGKHVFDLRSAEDTEVPSAE